MGIKWLVTPPDWVASSDMASAMSLHSSLNTLRRHTEEFGDFPSRFLLNKV